LVTDEINVPTVTFASLTNPNAGDNHFTFNVSATTEDPMAAVETASPAVPTASPTLEPTASPTLEPTAAPTAAPTAEPVLQGLEYLDVIESISNDLGDTFDWIGATSAEKTVIAEFLTNYKNYVDEEAYDWFPYEDALEYNGKGVSGFQIFRRTSGNSPMELTVTLKAESQIGMDCRIFALMDFDVNSAEICEWPQDNVEYCDNGAGYVASDSEGKDWFVLVWFNEEIATPTASPTLEPTASPTLEPTASPTLEPTASPTLEPTAAPTLEPTAAPSPTTTRMPGDITDTGDVTVADIVAVMDHIFGYTPLAGDDLAAAEALSDNGKIDIMVIMKLRAIILGLI